MATEVFLRDPVDAEATIFAFHAQQAGITRFFPGTGRDLPEPSLASCQAWSAWLRSHPRVRVIEVDRIVAGLVRLHPDFAALQGEIGARSACRGLSGQGYRLPGRRMTRNHARGETGLHRVELLV